MHGSVCRDYLEPATACGVHRGLGLPAECMIYDVSNACLGLLNGMVQVANMIELGQIEAGIVVGTESSRSLVETTIDALNGNTSLSRRDVKTAVASLTIGSGSAAAVLVDRRLSRTGNRVMGGLVRTNTEFCHLCRGNGGENAGEGSGQAMETDSETLMHEGVQTATVAFGDFLDGLGWNVDRLDKVFCHQVGRAHRKLLLQRLAIDPGRDYTTFEYLGNTGSVALPLTAAIGIERGHLRQGDHVGLLGIGSGINVLMLGVQWQHSLVEANTPAARMASPHRAIGDAVAGTTC